MNLKSNISPMKKLGFTIQKSITWGLSLGLLSAVIVSSLTPRNRIVSTRKLMLQSMKMDAAIYTNPLTSLCTKMTAPALRSIAQRRFASDPRNDPKFMRMIQFVMDQESNRSGPQALESNLQMGSGITAPALERYRQTHPNDSEAQQWQLGRTFPSSNLTLRIYHDIYKNSGADTLPDALGLVHFDAAVNQGQGAANKMLSQSDSDPNRYIQLRAARYAANPNVEQNPGWLQKRIPALQAAIGQYTQDPLQSALERSVP